MPDPRWIQRTLSLIQYINRIVECWYIANVMLQCPTDAMGSKECPEGKWCKPVNQGSLQHPHQIRHGPFLHSSHRFYGLHLHFIRYSCLCFDGFLNFPLMLQNYNFTFSVLEIIKKAESELLNSFQMSNQFKKWTLAHDVIKNNIFQFFLHMNSREPSYGGQC